MDYYSGLQHLARERLRSYWLRAMVALSALLAVQAIISLMCQLAIELSEIETSSPVYYACMHATVILTSVIAAPLMYGFKLFLWQRSSGDESSVAVIFTMFGSARRLFGSVLLNGVKYAVIWLPTIVFAAPALVLYNRELSIDEPIYIIAAFVLTVLALGGTVFGLYMAVRLVAADYVFVGEEIGAFAAIRRSLALTKGKFGYFLPLFFRFVPWLLLKATGFGQLFVTPYFEMAVCLYVRDLIRYTPNEDCGDTAVFDAVPDGGQL